MICENQNHHTCTENMERCQEYIEALEDERRKIQVFQRDLPLCLELVTRAIKACKQQLSGTRAYFRGQSECYELTSSEGPVIEEFISSIKKTSSSVDEEQSHKPENNNHNKNNDKSSNKLDWLRSVSLWNHNTDPPIKGELPRKVSVMELKGNAGGTFKGEKSVGTTPVTAMSASSFLAAEGSSTAETGGGSRGNKKEEKEGRSQRKARRSWSPELHRRFLHALQQLGGYHVATPKQIRELMKVDGLTNDEVKSHLQKYRLHTKRPTPSIDNNNNPQAVLQFVVVGGRWVSPPEFAVMATTAAASTGVATPNIGTYAPIAAPPPPLTQAESSQTQR